jgi:hypothetical protein
VAIGADEEDSDTRKYVPGPGTSMAADVEDVKPHWRLMLWLPAIVRHFYVNAEPGQWLKADFVQSCCGPR